MTVCPKKKKNIYIYILAELQSGHLRDVILTNRSRRGDAFGPFCMNDHLREVDANERPNKVQ